MKHKLTICCGTSCYLSVGNRIDELKQLITQEFGNQIEVSQSGCLGQCSKVGITSDPPYAKIDGKLLSNATNDNIIKELKKYLKTQPF